MRAGIYALVCPETGAARYIGQGHPLDTRTDHYRRTIRQLWHGEPVSGGVSYRVFEWMKTLRDRGLQPPEIRVVCEVVDPTNWDYVGLDVKVWLDRAEREYIALYSDLLNSTRGNAGSWTALVRNDIPFVEYDAPPFV